MVASLTELEGILEGRNLNKSDDLVEKSCDDQRGVVAIVTDLEVLYWTVT